ncbi:MAG: GspH/FimT family pseudopilin [Nitrospirae bacterium]|nr:GspH/FimT family pseudopilin [Nitrospirota bacterium]
MVMVIIAILAVAIVVRNPFDAIKLSSATRKVAGDIRYAQKLAISNQSRAGLVFAAAGYSVYRDMTVAAPYPAAVSPGDPCSTDSSNNFVVDFNDPRCSNYQNVTLAPPATTIAFNALGSPVDAAGGAIGPVTITVTYNGSQTITIAAGTGRVSY